MTVLSFFDITIGSMVEFLICDSLPFEGILLERKAIMKEWPYAKEPFDFKLFVLLFLKKIWIVVCAMVISAIVIGGGYYLKKVVFGGPAQYEITTSYYVDYMSDPETGAINSYVNEATWESWIVMDWFVDRTWEHALELGLQPQSYGVEKSDLTGFLSADLLTDVHIPNTTVVTESEELTVLLNKALQQTISELGEVQKEVLGVSVIDETQVREKDIDARTFRACVLGALIGLFFASFTMAFRILFDDSIHIPETFTYRYGIPMLGAVTKEVPELSEEAQANMGYVFGNKDNLAALVVDGKTEDVSNVLPDTFAVISKDELLQGGYERLRQAQGILLLVKAGANNSKATEHLLHELMVQECTVKGALLYHAEAKLLKNYRFGKTKK